MNKEFIKGEIRELENQIRFAEGRLSETNNDSWKDILDGYKSCLTCKINELNNMEAYEQEMLENEYQGGTNPWDL